MLPKQCSIRVQQCKPPLLESIKRFFPFGHSVLEISSEVHLVEGVADQFSKVGKLDIVSFLNSTSFLKRKVQSLEEPYLKFIFSYKEKEEMRKQYLPGGRQYLALVGCKSGEKLELALKSLSFLRVLSLRDLHYIDFLPEVPLPCQLRYLRIHDCPAFQSLPKA